MDEETLKRIKQEFAGHDGIEALISAYEESQQHIKQLQKVIGTYQSRDGEIMYRSMRVDYPITSERGE